ncbi:MAG: DNA translocase FtsK 4TM domain-containing protein, partial [Phycisphaerae bacterium]
MPRSAQRQSAFRFCVATLAWLACTFVWIALLSYDPADPPNTALWLPGERGVQNLCGPTGAWLAYHAFYFLGIGIYAVWIVVTLAILGWSKGVPLSDHWLRLVGLGFICTAVSTAGAMFLSLGERDLITGPGGALGAAAADFFVTRLDRLGTVIVLLSAFVVGLILTADELATALGRWLLTAGKSGGPIVVRGASAVASAGSALVSGAAGATARLATATAAATRGSAVESDATLRSNAEQPERASVAIRGRGLARDHGASSKEAPAPGAEIESANAAAVRSAGAGAARGAGVDSVGAEVDGALAGAAAAAGTRGRRVASADERPDSAEHDADEAAAQRAGGNGIATHGGERPAVVPAAPVVRTIGAKPKPEQEFFHFRSADDNYKLPPLDLLDELTPIDRESIEILCREKAYVLEQTLKEFRLEVQVVAVETGPVITVFELRLSPGIKVSQITSLQNDLARAMQAPSVRVVAPLPGKNTIGIEVPNIDKEKVRLRELIHAAASR